MYSDNFWNEIYSFGLNKPWMSEDWFKISINYIEKFIKQDIKKILDYGCGIGAIGNYLISKGFFVDFADISSKITSYLRKKVASDKCNVFTIDHPNKLTESYDLIICWGVMHHINPLFWDEFMDGFRKKLNNHGQLIIGGWDKNDVEFTTNSCRISKVTKAQTWYVNDIEKYIESGKFVLLYKDTFVFTEPYFDIKRTFTYYILS